MIVNQALQFYGNVGYYFAQRGMVVVLANHRLIPHAKYPDGAEDVRNAREWLYNNIASDKYGRGSPDKVIIFGHSSGGAHVAMDLYREGKSLATHSLTHSAVVL